MDGKEHPSWPQEPYPAEIQSIHEMMIGTVLETFTGIGTIFLNFLRIIGIVRSVLVSYIIKDDLAD